MNEIIESERKVAEATKVLLDLPEMNLDRNNPCSLMYRGNDDETNNNEDNELRETE